MVTYPKDEGALVRDCRKCLEEAYTATRQSGPGTFAKLLDTVIATIDDATRSKALNNLGGHLVPLLVLRETGEASADSHKLVDKQARSAHVEKIILKGVASRMVLNDAIDGILQFFNTRTVTGQDFRLRNDIVGVAMERRSRELEAVAAPKAAAPAPDVLSQATLGFFGSGRPFFTAETFAKKPDPA